MKSDWRGWGLMVLVGVRTYLVLELTKEIRMLLLWWVADDGDVFEVTLASFTYTFDSRWI